MNHSHSNPKLKCHKKRPIHIPIQLLCRRRDISSLSNPCLSKLFSLFQFCLFSQSSRTFSLVTIFDGTSILCDRVRRRIPAIPLPIYPLVTLLTTTWTQDEPFKSRGASSPISDIGLSAFLKVDRFEPSSVFLKASPHHSSLTERAPLLLALLFEPTNLSFETPESFFLSENHGTSFAPVRPVVASGATLILQRVSLYGLDTQFRQMGLNLSFTSTRPNDLIGPGLSFFKLYQTQFVGRFLLSCWMVEDSIVTESRLLWFGLIVTFVKV
ncbi:unnamed protein product [Arabidopsis lyrata]|nr:unnamed protein product [Arabidopsis lyrata]